MLLQKFDAPGFLNDATEEQLVRWSEQINGYFEHSRLKGNGKKPCPQFYNPTVTETAADKQTKDISWTAFPRIVQIGSTSDSQRWRRADRSRDVQDEYCEWSVKREQSGKIISVSFTCEGPEYWEFLAENAPAKVLQLYQEFISQDVQMSDLFDDTNTYLKNNKWNSSPADGAMHLIQQSNSLFAEIFLAAGASVPRKRPDGTIITDEQELILCGDYGAESRHSDPHIGALVNELARTKAFITLENPVGLYFGGLNAAGWETPDGTPAQSFWKYVRGTDEKPVRAIFEIPAELGYVVGDIKINGQNINFGAQIADFISIKLTGVATRFGESIALPQLCVGQLSDESEPLADPINDNYLKFLELPTRKPINPEK